MLHRCLQRLPRTFVLFAFALPCFPQGGESTEILGIVQDFTGAVMPGVAVSATHIATNQTRRVTTGDSGTFVLSAMQPGEYTVRAEKEGFRAEVRTGLVLQINQKARVNFTLQIGSVAESVEVTASGLLLATDDATLGNVVEQKRVVDLPLNGRNFAHLAGLMPGVIKGISSNTNQYGRRDSAIAISANGIRENQGQVRYDGVYTAWNINNATFFRASIEAIQEFKVHSATYSAEFGHNAGAQVEIHTRPGTNELHGALFSFVRNDVFDARNYFRPEPLSKDILQRNQFGFVLSGPVFLPKVYDGRNRTFWMMNYEGQREKQEVAQLASVLPAAFRQGDFSALTTTLRDPLGGTFPNNIVPSSRLHPISRNYLDFHPLPTGPGTGANLSGLETQVNDVDQYFIRGDHNLGDNDRLFGRVAIYNYEFPTTELNYFAPLQSRLTARNAVLSHTHLFSATVLNELKVGFNRNWILRRGLRTNTNFDPESMGLTGVRATDPETRQPRALSPFETGIVPFNISGYLTMGDGGLIPDFNVSETWQLVDNFTVTRGVHTFKWGIDFKRLRMDRAGSNNARGQFQFNGQVTGHQAADFYLGFPSLSQTPDGVQGVEYNQQTYSFYVQDEWKATPKLTLNLGMRYDFVGTVDEENGFPRTLRIDRPGGYLFPEDPLSKVPTKLYRAEKNRFWPRIGIAYRPTDSWVVRTGFGVYNNANQINNLTVIGNPFRTFQVQFIADPADPLALTLNDPYPIGRAAAAPPLSVVAVPTERVNAYNVQWSFSLQRQLSPSTAFEAAYVGSQASHLDNSRNANDAPPGAGPVQQRRRYPLWGPVRWLGSDGKSYFQSLQLRGERRFSRGFSFLAAYTWAHNIDQSYGTNESLPFSTNGAQNMDCWACERSDSGFDYRHRYTTSFLWDIPAPGDWRGIKRAVLKGWSLNGIVTYQSGFPFTVTQQGNRQNTGGSPQRPDYVPGQDPKLANATPDRWFNTAAFQFADLKFGNVGRNTLRQPGMKTWDVGLFKEFPVREGHRFQFRFEAFNLFNTPQFRAPNAVLGTPAFGQITATWLDNRQLQLALKYLF
ncbi:MAG: TonB-dependent receptor [Bryobacteraceae bacterium]|nr:TonB-dependent receptor [Bryobacteraceae bacterium]